MDLSQAPTASKELNVLSYNILDVELESNFVPRTMHPSCIKAINAADKLNYTFPTIKDSKTKKDRPMTVMEVIGAGYLDFHQGFTVNGKKTPKPTSRDMWAQSEPFTKEDVYKDKDNTKKIKNLKQILIDIFGDGTANRLYDIIEKFNDANNKWDAPSDNNRFSRVFQKIMSYNADIICLQEYGNCKNKPVKQSGGGEENNNSQRLENLSTFASEKNKQIDAEEENNAKVEAMSTGRTLACKLINSEYVYKLFSHNQIKDDGDDGVAIFFRKDKFTFIEKVYVDMDSVIKSTYKIKNSDTKAYTTQRGCGLLRLKIKSNNQEVIICTTHIQTSSNEVNGKKRYEIRKGELDFIKDHIQTNYQGQPVIFCGDLNLDLNTENDKAVIDDFGKGFLTRIQSNAVGDDLGLVTSYPSERQDYLDYFFTNCGGTLRPPDEYKNKKYLDDKKDADEQEVIPSVFDVKLYVGDDQPSDHIPILLTIPLPLMVKYNNVLQQPSQGGKKSRRRRRKTQKKPKRKTRKNNKRKNSKSKK